MTATMMWAAVLAHGCGAAPRYRRIEIAGLVTTESSTPLAGAKVRPNPQTGELRSGGEVQSDLAGRFLLAMTVREDADHATFRATAVGRAPLLVRVELHGDVGRYGAAFVMTPLQVAALNVGAVTNVAVVLAGRAGNIQVPALPPGAVLRYAPSSVSGSLRAQDGEAGTALQAIASLYVELVDQSQLAPVANPPTLTITLDPSGVPAIAGAGTPQVYGLGDEALWVNGAELTTVAGAQTFPAQSGGTYLVGRSHHTACVLGKVTAVSGGCAGARVLAAGAEGTVSVDSVNAAGAYCVTGAPGANITVVAAGMNHAVHLLGLGTCSDPPACAQAAPVLLTADQCAATTGERP